MKIALTFFRKSSKIMTTQLTAPIYYYDSNGYKIGPVRKRDIIALAERGEITPETRITDNNIEVKAKNIPKLKFYAPEFHRAEEIFDPKNIDYNIDINSIIPAKISQASTGTKFGQNKTTKNQTTIANQDKLSHLTYKLKKIPFLYWITDIPFQNIRLPLANLWSCRIIYAIHCIAAISYGILVTILCCV